MIQNRQITPTSHQQRAGQANKQSGFVDAALSSNSNYMNVIKESHESI